MTHQVLLNYQFQQHPTSTQPTLVFIHGLFGDMNNLGVIAKGFTEQYSILRIDLANHGQSFHYNPISYQQMAKDIADLLDDLQLNNVILVGHSMGGKVAMRMANNYAKYIKALVVIDIAPVSYPDNWHEKVFEALFAVKRSDAETRQQAKAILAKHIENESVQQFLLKSFNTDSIDKFRFNLTALYQSYADLMSWQTISPSDVPVLFIKGGLSNYIQLEHSEKILAQFPQATSFTINGTGHWLHSEKPEAVIRAIQRFLQSNESSF